MASAARVLAVVKELRWCSRECRGLPRGSRTIWQRAIERDVRIVDPFAWSMVVRSRRIPRTIDPNELTRGRGQFADCLVNTDGLIGAIGVHCA